MQTVATKRGMRLVSIGWLSLFSVATGLWLGVGCGGKSVRVGADDPEGTGAADGVGGCSGLECEPEGSGGSSSSAGRHGVSTGGASQGSGGVELQGGDGNVGLGGEQGEVPEVPPSNPCSCTGRELCCLASYECFDPEQDPAACPQPAGRRGGEPACASDAHCDDGEYCAIDGAGCWGTGYCQSKRECGRNFEPVCGCDGVTYENRNVACRLGVNHTWPRGGACGEPRTNSGGAGAPNGDELTVIACGNEHEHCPAGQSCCSITGFCYPEADPGQCAIPPEGTLFPCTSDDQCDSNTFCFALSCEGPGGCGSTEIDCGGVLSPVCGCDNVNYTNERCAQKAGVRVASQGECQ